MKRSWMAALLLFSNLCFASESPDIKVILRTMHIGTNEAAIRHIFGSENIAVGGPPSVDSRTYEISGPTLEMIQGKLGANNLSRIVFEKDRSDSEYRLVYFWVELSSERLSVLVENFKRSGYRQTAVDSKVSCWSSNRERIALVKDISSESKPITWILEANKKFLREKHMKGNWLRPSVEDYCGVDRLSIP